MKSDLESKPALMELILAIDDRDAELNDDELHALIKYCIGVLIRRKCEDTDKYGTIADRLMEMLWEDEDDE